ncbi:MAG: DUF819 family protein [Oscillibacter sp.]|jgi:uncharacterized membrane protein|nr:DUF819 family protein [Oscillibacter sp.]
MLGSFFMNWLGRETLVAADDTWTLMLVMCAGVALAIFLEQKYRWASKVSGAIIALIVAMLLANFNIIPTSCVLYDDIVWGIVVPMGIPLLLLQCNIKKIFRETGRMLTIFVIGAVGTVVGAFLAYFLLRGPFGNAQDLAKVAAMMTGSYIGGGVNFAAMASQYAAGQDLTAAATVADNLLMAAYFFVLIAFAGMRFFRKNFRHPLIDEVEADTANRDAAQTQAAAFWSRKDISLKDIAFNFAYCIAIVWVSKLVAGGIAGWIPEDPNAFLDFVGKFFGSQYVWITTFSVIVATFMDKKVEQLHGSQELGTYLIYLFLFVIGVPANIMTVLTKSPLLLALTAIMVIVNMLFCFLAAKLFKFNLEDAIIASNANIGGPTTAAGMAISQGWSALVGPAMLIGTLGYVIGNYLGVIVGTVLGA